MGATTPLVPPVLTPMVAVNEQFRLLVRFICDGSSGYCLLNCSVAVGGFRGGEVQLRNISISWLYAHAIKSPVHIWCKDNYNSRTLAKLPPRNGNGQLKSIRLDNKTD